ncbi:MAG: hypothetical protein A2Y86_04520 [Candidatus Aminicenantes bacterium RBG_13_62_12]|nr:MAG: hypothetical protein A2Y86_04520 [Candidatus Aminicenantes bacterium RBG_13_62_12]
MIDSAGRKAKPKKAGFPDFRRRWRPDGLETVGAPRKFSAFLPKDLHRTDGPGVDKWRRTEDN